MTFRYPISGLGLYMAWQCLITLLSLACLGKGAETFTVMTYNVENYLVKPFGTRKAKPEASREKVVQILKAANADVVALQEMGRREAFVELQGRLKQTGLHYPHAVWMDGPDPAIQLALLSRFPLHDNRSKARVDYLLDGRRYSVSRGIGEVEIQVNAKYRFTMFNVHLKSKRPVGHADQSAIRLEEARAVRKCVEDRLRDAPDINLLLVGDLNDSPDSDPVKDLIGRKKPRLTDLRPVEHNEDQAAHPYNPRYGPRRVAWTHFYGLKDEYSRLDYLLASTGMARELDRTGTRILAVADWGTASDHRPVVARFVAEDR